MTVKLFAALKQRLVTYADAEKGFARFNEPARRLHQLLILQRVQTIIECPDARQNGSLSLGKFFGLRHHPHFRPNFEQRFVDASQIPRSVIQQCNHDLSLRCNPRGDNNQLELKDGASVTDPVQQVQPVKAWVTLAQIKN